MPADKEAAIDSIRPDLSEVMERQSFGLDERRPEAVARRQKKNRRTARANVTDLCDSERFIEYGALAIAAQRGRRSVDDLINGVVDIAVADDPEAVAVARQYLSYFQGTTSPWEADDQRVLRGLIPESRRRVYDIRAVIKALADRGSFLELRPKFGPGIITGFIRIEGRPFGLMANNCLHMAGAIEAEGADKAARFMQLCNVHGLPMLSLCDTPGFMVGPEIEKRAQVRHVCRMFVIGSHVTVPYFTVVLRRGYGLGAMAMAKGGFHESFFTTSWPTGEFGTMGLEGAVKAGFKKELEAVENQQEREILYDKLVAQLVERGKAIHMASYLEIDAVIDPADTRKWIMQGLKSIPAGGARGTGHAFVDPW
jgi:acetyl-CoA carboxylase carboxyltransferase component